MGIYDQYEDVQLKIGDVCCNYYRIGDKVKIDDGVYIAPDGAVVIKDGKLLMTTHNIQDKWGGVINVKTRNPIFHVAKEILNEQLQAENERLKGLIERYGTEPSKFDWGILETIDELETELENKNEKINAVKTAIEIISQTLKETK